jgi:multidrug efflux pump subunit AcrB
MTLKDQVVASVITTLSRKNTCMSSFYGPLGGHRNYLTHIALPNCFEFLSLQQHHRETNDSSIRAKYEELRRFLNAVESLNNTLEYAYYEMNPSGARSGFDKFQKIVYEKHNSLQELAELTNAYKHSIRQTKRDIKVRSARDLQKPELHIAINISEDKKVSVNADYEFDGPLSEHLEIFHNVLRFWHNYHNSPASTEFTDLNALDPC